MNCRFVAWQGEGKAPVDRESFIEFTRELRTQTCYHAIKGATMIGKVAHFLFRESRYRHFSELEPLPNGLLPVADAFCCFNPVHGQGMSVAALEADAFRELLEAGGGDFHDLPRAFLRRADQIIEAPWNMAAAPDLALPGTRGERPPNLMQALMFGSAFMELAARDVNAHKLMWEIRSLLKPYSALTSDAALMRRVQTVMAEMAQAETGATASV